MENNYYLVFLIDFIEDSYIVVPISAQNLIKLLNEEITVRKPFEVSQVIYCVKCGKKYVDDTIIEKTLSEISKVYLPDEDFYLETRWIENAENYIQE